MKYLDTRYILRNYITPEDKMLFEIRKFQNKQSKLEKTTNKRDNKIKKYKKSFKPRFILDEEAMYSQARVYKDSWLKVLDDMGSKKSIQSGRYDLNDYYSKTHKQVSDLLEKLSIDLKIYKVHLRVVIQMYMEIGTVYAADDDDGDEFHKYAWGDDDDHKEDLEVEFLEDMVNNVNYNDAREKPDNEYSYFSRTTPNMTITELDNTFKELFTKTFKNLLDKTIEEDESDRKDPKTEKKPVGSGWLFDRVESFSVHIAKYKPIEAGNYIKLPSILADKKCIINVDNSDISKNGVVEGDCFKWALLSAMHPCDNSNRVTNYIPYVDKYNWDGITYPATIEHIKLFEKNNNKKINVYQLQVKKLIQRLDLDELDSNVNSNMIDVKEICDLDINTFDEIIYNKIKTKIEKSNEFILKFNDICDRNEKIKITPIMTNHFDGINLGIYENHYVWIKNLNGLFKTKNGFIQFRCPKCCYNAANKVNLQKHIDNCKDQGIGICEMPEKDKAFMEFKNINKMLKKPFVIYGDFESSIVNVTDDSKNSTIKINKHLPNSFGLVPVSIDENFNKTNGYKMYREDENNSDCIDKFCIELKKLGEVIMPIMKKEQYIRMTGQDIKDFASATECYICKNQFEVINKNDKVMKKFYTRGKTKTLYYINSNDENVIKSAKKHFSCLKKNTSYPDNKYYLFNGLSTDKSHFTWLSISDEELPRTFDHINKKYILNKGFKVLEYELKWEQVTEKECVNTSGSKVRDHCHITGKYRGAAHSKCNILLRKSKKPFIPVVLHNLKGYDAHLIMQKIGTYFKEEITVIAKSDENYLSFAVGYFRFIDSYSFLSMSLDRLSNLLDKKKDFKILQKNFQSQLSVKQMNILKEKGIYPYEWLDDKVKFNKIKFPEIEAFYSKLNDSKLSQTEYDRGKEIYRLLNCKNFGDYHDIYLKTDVLILADVCEKFRIEFKRL